MKWLEELIDTRLELMQKQERGMMMVGVTGAMLDTSIPPSNDWSGWKPIPSVITDEDLNRLEEKIQIALPQSYRHLLKYKHFYDLRLADYYAHLFSHLPDKEMKGILDYMQGWYVGEILVQERFIYFADFSDYGLLCFDARNPAIENEYPVVYIDHEDPTDIFLYANNFHDFMEADSETGNRFIHKLNEYYRKKEGRE